LFLNPGEDWEGKIEIIPYVDGAPAYTSCTSDEEPLNDPGISNYRDDVDNERV